MYLSVSLQEVIQDCFICSRTELWTFAWYKRQNNLKRCYCGSTGIML